MIYNYRATVDRVVDGDTVDMVIDLGFNVSVHERLRLTGIDAPEKRGAEKEAGINATLHLIYLLDTYQNLEIETVKDKKGKYGRYLATIWGLHGDNCSRVNINKRMVLDGHAVEKEY